MHWVWHDTETRTRILAFLRLIMAALRSRCGHYIFVLFLLFSSFFPRLISAVADWMYTILLHMMWPYSANLECRSKMCCTWLAWNAGPKKSPKIHHLGTIAELFRTISSQLRHISTIGKNLLNANIFPTRPYNIMNFGPLAAEICWRVWGTPANVNGFRALAALLHATRVVGVSQTLWRWTEGATYLRQGGHHVGHWPTF